MSNDVSAFGIKVNIIASNTFPTGFTVTQFADDADPLDFASIKIGNATMGVNGDLIRWASAVALPMVLNVIPGSDDNINLQALSDANRVGKGKISARDTITATVVYPDGSITTMTGGVITDGQSGKSGSSQGRLKTQMYGFSFEQKI